MVVKNAEGTIWKLKFGVITQELYRITNKGFQTLAPAITKAYLDYQIEKILLEENE